jgi:hypothetical protein
MPHDPFLDDRPRTRVSTSAGEAELPFVARDACMVAAFFRVSAARAAAALAGTPFAPVRLLGGSAVAALAFVDYRDTPVGPYGEAMAALAVVPEGVAPPPLPAVRLLRASSRRDVGFHILDVPVTGRAPYVNGRELWGFPKFVTRVDLDVDPETHGVRGVLHAPAGDEPILVLEGRVGPGIPVPAMDLVFYSVLGGRVLRTVANARGRTHLALGARLALRVGRGTHAMADRLEALGLSSAHPVAAELCTRYQVVLNAGEPISLARAA